MGGKTRIKKKRGLDSRGVSKQGGKRADSLARSSLVPGVSSGVRPRDEGGGGIQVCADQVEPGGVLKLKQFNVIEFGEETHENRGHQSGEVPKNLRSQTKNE